MAGVGIALSGGGHRASLFGLGALLYLVDAGRHRDIVSISSVSGGSITNAFVAQAIDLRDTDPASFRAAVKPFATQLAQRGTFQGTNPRTRFKLLATALLLTTGFVWLWPETSRWFRYGVHLGALAVVATPLVWTLFATALGRAYGVVLVLTLAALALPPWVAPLPSPLHAPFLRFALFLVGLMLWVWLVFSRRGWVCEGAYRTTLFERDGRENRLAAISRQSTDHVLCATDLQSGEHVYFSGNFVYGYRFGKGTPGDLRLSMAVRASANLPFAFPALWLKTNRFGFRYPKDDVPANDRGPEWKDCPEPRDRPKNKRYMVLADGGVYDNMADQWPQGFRGRSECWPSLPEEHHEPEVLIVVNASQGLDWKTMKRSRIPGLGGVFALLKVKDVLYDQTTAQRRAGLVGRFDRAELEARAGQPGRMRGALVHIPQSPYDVPRAYQKSAFWSDRAKRARTVLAELEEASDDWEAIARADAEVPTVLSALGTEVAARLIRHGYVLAMANLHTILDYPCFAVPDEQPFRDLVGG